ncbi:MAG: zinc ribbon domain-containing protein [Anaerolineae bacterium]
MRATDGYLWPEQPGHTAEPAAVCPRCGRTVAPEARFCASCGAALTTIACPSCGSRARVGARFCVSCGAALQPETVPQPGRIVIRDNATIHGPVIDGPVQFNVTGGDLNIGGSKGSVKSSGVDENVRDRRSGSAMV